MKLITYVVHHHSKRSIVAASGAKVIIYDMEVVDGVVAANSVKALAIAEERNARRPGEKLTVKACRSEGQREWARLHAREKVAKDRKFAELMGV